MTDAEAALLATTRKQGNHLMASQKKIKYVSKVYNLYDLSLKTIKNYPKYLLAPHDFMYSADIIMPAMERLDEKCLHKVSFIWFDNHIECIFSLKKCSPI